MSLDSNHEFGGLLAALAAAAQDALFTDRDAATLGAFGRYRPFVTGQAIAVLSLPPTGGRG